MFLLVDDSYTTSLAIAAAGCCLPFLDALHPSRVSALPRASTAADHQRSWCRCMARTDCHPATARYRLPGGAQAALAACECCRAHPSPCHSACSASSCCASGCSLCSPGRARSRRGSGPPPVRRTGGCVAARSATPTRCHSPGRTATMEAPTWLRGTATRSHVTSSLGLCT